MSGGSIEIINLVSEEENEETSNEAFEVGSKVNVLYEALVAGFDLPSFSYSRSQYIGPVEVLSVYENSMYGIELPNPLLDYDDVVPGKMFKLAD